MKDNHAENQFTELELNLLLKSLIERRDFQKFEISLSKKNRPKLGEISTTLEEVCGEHEVEEIKKLIKTLDALAESEDEDSVGELLSILKEHMHNVNDQSESDS